MNRTKSQARHLETPVVARPIGQKSAAIRSYALRTARDIHKDIPQAQSHDFSHQYRVNSPLFQGHADITTFKDTFTRNMLGAKDGRRILWEFVKPDHPRSTTIVVHVFVPALTSMGRH